MDFTIPLLKPCDSIIDRSQLEELSRDPNRTTISNPGTDPEVIRVGHLAIKFGTIFAEEAINQQEAYKLLDPAIIRVPRVYDFFYSNGIGFLVMEYNEGSTMGDPQDERWIPTIARALCHLHSFHRRNPGPLAGGPSHGLIWTDSQEVRFESTDSLERYLNSKLVEPADQICLESAVMVLCHLDVAPRNICLLEDGALCLMDWESAGYYPRFFEFCATRLNCGSNGKDNRYSQLLEAEMRGCSPLEATEEENFKLMLRVIGNNIRYNL